MEPHCHKNKKQKIHKKGPNQTTIYEAELAHIWCQNTARCTSTEHNVPTQLATTLAGVIIKSKLNNCCYISYISLTSQFSSRSYHIYNPTSNV